MDDNPSALLQFTRPTLPVPVRERWQPLRMGVVELFHYDSEEFWFRDGHLLLRGNNGTGKSKVLSLTLPFLLDAQLNPSRVEPDGDPGKRMAWNLLMGVHERRVGYTWIEFGRLQEDGTPLYLSLGAGLSAKAARAQVEAWFFVLEDPGGARINHDLWLTNDQRVVLSKERLRELLHGRGQVFEAARDYRRAVDERLFHLGRRRYDALMDTLIQLRQPQLSKRPDETALSDALTEALPPLAPELLADVAEALGRLEEDRRQLQDFQKLAAIVTRFEERYRTYAGTLSRREARSLRQAQTEFDNASRARNEALARYESARAEEEKAQAGHGEADAALRRARARLEALRDDPRNEDANALDRAERDSSARDKALRDAKAAAETSARRLEGLLVDLRDATARMEQAEQALREARRQSAVHAAGAGIVSALQESPLVALDAEALLGLNHRDFESACGGLGALVAKRRDEIALLERRRSEVERAERKHADERRIRDERQLDADRAAERRGQADIAVERQGQALVDSWERHFVSLRQLAIESDESIAALSALAEWVAAIEGDNPARHVLQALQQRNAELIAERSVALQRQYDALEAEVGALQAERDRLEGGIDPGPAAPYTRADGVRQGRKGAPLWHLVDFRESVTETERAGLEAGLEAAGLLDAWVSPDGRLHTADSEVALHDTQALARSPLPAPLSDWLVPAIPPGSAVLADIVAQVLSGIACGLKDAVDTETWVSPEGRFRLGALAGAWAKPAAVHIGLTARSAARAQRLAEIAQRLAQLAGERVALQSVETQIARDRDQAADEWRRAPADDALRNAHLAAAGAARDLQAAQARLAEADDRRGVAAEELRVARDKLATDAADLRLPEGREALIEVGSALDRYRDMTGQLAQTGRELRVAAPQLDRFRRREAEDREDMRNSRERLATAQAEQNEAAARLQALRDRVGTQVDELKRQVTEARNAEQWCDDELKRLGRILQAVSMDLGAAQARANTANETLQHSTQARARAVGTWQQFNGTGLLAAALPALDTPDMTVPWTIDPALTLARRVEQELVDVKEDPETWTRLQKQFSEQLTELQRALSAMGQQVIADIGDWGPVVHIMYQNRPDRPDRLAARLADEIVQRTDLLSAREREVLENHLQAEIATEIQRLLQNAERQRDAINIELHKRPTTTGVRFRLIWDPLSEDEGAPVGLEAARRRLLNTSADLWSADDRGVVGAMLRERIAAERAGADSPGGDGGSLLEQLANALDYRHWHRFRVERWQDGHWRKLSGPASSGERALGVTVPLFAAVASFYSQGSDPNAPRLILLDEAFAGIDDAARAHCMGLIREFDLDFVLTSEREWACYAELPGVAICQLQKREGIDAVYVSRWTWDGRARNPEADPDRRFAPS